jgi:hypothetical protein
LVELLDAGLAGLKGACSVTFSSFGVCNRCDIGRSLDALLGPFIAFFLVIAGVYGGVSTFSGALDEDCDVAGAEEGPAYPEAIRMCSRRRLIEPPSGEKTRFAGTESWSFAPRVARLLDLRSLIPWALMSLAVGRLDEELPVLEPVMMRREGTTASWSVRV